MVCLYTGFVWTKHGAPHRSSHTPGVARQHGPQDVQACARADNDEKKSKKSILVVHLWCGKGAGDPDNMMQDMQDFV